MKVLCAMSGGVDSSVAAALLKEQGYRVIGTTMLISGQKKDFGGCCSLKEIEDAKAVCGVLGIPHYTLNYRNEFNGLVVKNFIDEYKNGRTPNPCIRCNAFLKFDLLVRKAEELGCDYIATGHYARIEPSPTPISSGSPPLPEGEGNKRGEGLFKLYKGIDSKKDQSYALYMMDQKSLGKTIFPIGKNTKTKVRKLAKEFNLPVAEKAESQDICFVEGNDYGKFLLENIPQAAEPGKILDRGGRVAGKHKGIIFYTIGQKKGIGSHGAKKFVIDIDAQSNTIMIGGEDDLAQKTLTADRLSFTSGKPPKGKVEILAKIRYNSCESPAILEVSGSKANVNFKEAQRAITPGQSVVFYHGDEVLGGGIICKR